MVYIHSWQEYQDAAEALYAKSPDKTRYTIKWRGSEGKLVLKITDNTTCIKFKTYSSIFLNRFEALNLSLMQKMQNVRRQQQPPATSTPALPEVGKTAGETASAVEGQQPIQDSSTLSGGTAPTHATPSGAGVKKKKKGKKK